MHSYLETDPVGRRGHKLPVGQHTLEKEERQGGAHSIRTASTMCLKDTVLQGSFERQPRSGVDR